MGFKDLISIYFFALQFVKNFFIKYLLKFKQKSMYIFIDYLNALKALSLFFALFLHILEYVKCKLITFLMKKNQSTLFVMYFY